MFRCWQLITIALGGCLPTVLHAALPPWTLDIERLSAGDARLENISITSTLDGEEKRGVQLQLARVGTGAEKSSYGPVSLHCPGDPLQIMRELCRQGDWTAVILDGWPQLSGVLSRVSVGEDGAQIDTRGSFDAVTWSASARVADGNLALTLEFPEQPVAALGFLQARLQPLGWISAGRFGGTARLSGGAGKRLEARTDLEFTGIDFDSPDGLYAGLGLGVRFSAVHEDVPGAAIALNGSLSAGELLLGDFYRDFSDKALQAEARVVIEGDQLDVPRLTVSDGDALYLAGEAGVGLTSDAPAPELLLREFRLALPEAYTRYIEPVAAVLTLDGLETGGAVSWTGDWSPGSARSGELRLENLSIRDVKRGRFAVESLDGTLKTGSDSRLSWSAATFEKLDLGSGSAGIALTQESVSLLEPLRIGVFGGHLSLDELSVGIPRQGEPDIRLRAEIDGIEMQQMSAALGWPEFSGTLSGSIPGVNWSGGVIEIQGALDFQVFGGQMRLTDLRVERPFGVLPSLAANVAAADLDLEQITQTFEFGRIAGRIEGYVHDLRMLDWRPVRFDAWFGTPEGAGRNDISRQAVRHLATIGGGSATAILSGPVLRLFNNFSYRRLGLGCMLQDNVCRIRGIEEQGDAVLLLEGAGIPKISILAYNRAVDWPQLVAELTAVSGGDEVKIGN